MNILITTRQKEINSRTKQVMIITALLSVLALSGMAQTEEPSSQKEIHNWAAGGLVGLLGAGPNPEYYDKNIEYNPPTPVVWFGSSWLNGSMKENMNLRSGVFNKIDAGVTILQISRNLYKGVVGVSASLQFGVTEYTLSSGFRAKKDGHRVDIVSSDENQKRNTLSFTAMRLPLLVGAQTNNRMFSLQTGFGLCHTSRFGAQWLVTAGLGPITFNYSKNLTPLFKLNDGTEAYPSSFTLGIDIMYMISLFSHPE